MVLAKIASTPFGEEELKLEKVREEMVAERFGDDPPLEQDDEERERNDIPPLTSDLSSDAFDLTCSALFIPTNRDEA